MNHRALYLFFSIHSFSLTLRLLLLGCYCSAGGSLLGGAAAQRARRHDGGER
jgi:hypothetical protein